MISGLRPLFEHSADSYPRAGIAYAYQDSMPKPALIASCDGSAIFESMQISEDVKGAVDKSGSPVVSSHALQAYGSRRRVDELARGLIQ